MKPRGRQRLALLVAVITGLALGPRAVAQVDPMPSWNDGQAKQAIIAFAKTTTDSTSAGFVPLAERIATFDQDGTLWVEYPLYTQVVYCLDRVPSIVKLIALSVETVTVACRPLVTLAR